MYISFPFDDDTQWTVKSGEAIVLETFLSVLYETPYMLTAIGMGTKLWD
jgi:hypothetical protein